MEGVSHRDFCLYLAKSYQLKSPSTLVVQTGVTPEEWRALVERDTFSVCILQEGNIHESLNPRNNLVVALYWVGGGITREEFA